MIAPPAPMPPAAPAAAPAAPMAPAAPEETKSPMAMDEGPDEGDREADVEAEAPAERDDIGAAEDDVGPPVDLQRHGDPVRGWPRVWDDAWDSVIDTGLSIDDVLEGALIECWYRGYWWRATVWRIARSANTVEVRWMHNGQRTPGYRITLCRRPVAMS